MTLPEHIRVTDTTVRRLEAACDRCQARVFFGPDSGGAGPQADELLEAWLDRHRHGLPEEKP